MGDSTNSNLPQNRVVISEDLRDMEIPESQKTLGAVGDDKVRKVWFDCPRECDGVDMGDFSISVHFRNDDGDVDRYDVTEKTVTDDTITFAWLVTRTACAVKGYTTVSVKLREMDGTTVLREFNSASAKFKVKNALDNEAQPDQATTDYVAAFIAEADEDIDDAVSRADAATAAVYAALADLSLHVSYDNENNVTLSILTTGE